MTRLFGFIQFDFAGALAIADGRYLVRDGGREQVLVIETLGAPPPARRRRKRPRGAEIGEPPPELPVARVTVVLAFNQLEDEREAATWLQGTSNDEGAVDQLIERGIDELNRALHAHAVASGDPYPQTVTPARAVVIRVGYGGGEALADGAFTSANRVDPGLGSISRRRQRDEELRPQQRLAAVLGGREQLDACETLLLRARADLDAGRNREAALQLRVGLEALLIELKGAFSDPDHDEDMAILESSRNKVGELANTALQGNLNATQLKAIRDTQAVCERVLRRRRVLGS
ncbi:MAG TPA: hypothetical protein VKH20_03040 [Solirubrobacterales bacterium]|nr:hypothetical protein [Solirubrobacterales bacterium]